MRKILIVAFLLLSYFAYSQPGSISQSVIRSRVNDSTAAIAANVSAIAAGYAPMFFNNQATVPHWCMWNGTAYDHVFDFNSGTGGSSLTAGSGITIVGDSINWNGALTEDVVMNGVFGVDWGQTTALTRFRPQAQYMKITAIDSLNLSIAGTFGTPNQVLKTDGTKASWQNDTGTGSVNTFAKNAQSGNYTLQQSDTVRTILMSSASDQTLTIPTGMKGGSIFMVMQDSTNTITIDASAVTVDENTSGTLTLTKGFISTIFYKNSTRVVISKNSAAAGGGHIIQDEGTSVTARDTLDFAGSGVTLSDVSGKTLVTIPLHTVNASSSLTDGATITITATKHTLTSTQATITWTLSQVEDFQTTDIILNATTTTWTFPANALCVVEGVPSGNNTAVLLGSSGDHYILSIYKDGTNYRVVIKNFSQ